MFVPVFDVVELNEYDAAADAINLVHEDYPNRVESTGTLIAEMIAQGYSEITQRDLRMIHSELFPDIDERGMFRTRIVTVGGNSTCDPLHIQEEMDKLGDISTSTKLTQWYTNFQIIHPFIDGNGRVGGVALAVMSAVKCGFMIVPKGV